MSARQAFPALLALLAMLVVSGAMQGCISRPPTRGPTPPTQPAQAPAASPAPSTSSPASSPPSAEPVPARLGGGAQGGAGASAQCLAEIEAFAERHSGNRVMLGQAAFADSDRLVLTRVPRRAPDGTALDGRAPPPAPLVLGLRLGAGGCSVRILDAGQPLGQPAGRAPDPAAAAGDSVLLPACTCAPLAR